MLTRNVYGHSPVPRAPIGPVVTTKLQPPSQRRGLLPRDALAAGLDPYLERRLVLVSAPAGYGKTGMPARRDLPRHRALDGENPSNLSKIPSPPEGAERAKFGECDRPASRAD